MLSRSLTLLLAAERFQASALTSPRGWNSWNDYFGNANETQTILAAKYMQQTLLSYGFNVVTTDEGWYQGDGSAYANIVDAYGRPTPDVKQFPSASNGQGFKALTSQIHAMGLLFGVWTLRGIPKIANQNNLPIYATQYTMQDAAGNDAPCVWQPQTMGCKRDPSDPTQCNAAAKAYYASVAQWYAAQGIDFVKIDCMGGVADVPAPGLADPDLYAFTGAMRSVNITVSLSSGNGVTPANGTVYLQKQLATQYRVTPDFWDTWEDPNGPGQFPTGLRSKLDTALAYTPLLQGGTVPPNGSLPWTGGVFPDLDMLQLGDICTPSGCPGGPQPTKFSQVEQVFLMSLWCVTGSPLIFGGRLPLRQEDSWTLSLLTNPEVLAVHGNADSRAAVQTVNGAGQPFYAWTAVPTATSVAGLPITAPASYLGVFNGADWPANITVALADIRLGDWHTYCARDLWAHAPVPGAQSLPGGKGLITVELPAHGASMMLVQNCG